VLDPADPPTLRSREIDCFDVSPTRCDDCYLPCCQHESLPGIAFSLLLSCPHTTDLLDAEILAHNEALKTLLGDRGLPCLGNVVVVKHHFRSGLEASNLDLPVLDIDPLEFHIVDELLLQCGTRSPPFLTLQCLQTGQVADQTQWTARRRCVLLPTRSRGRGGGS